MGSSSQHNPALSRHINDVYPQLDGLLAAAEAAQALSESAGWPVLLSLLDAEIATIDAKLDSGLLGSKAEYAYLHGRRGGLRAVPASLATLIDRAEKRVEEQRRRHEGAAEPVPLEVT